MAMDFPSSPTLDQKFTSGGIVYTWNGYAWSGGAPVVPPPRHGQCRYRNVDVNACRLSPYNGNALIINDNTEIVPAGGVALSAAGTAGNATVYYIYAYMNAGVMTLEASLTAYAIHTNGVVIKSGDPTRTLVGMSRTNVGGTSWGLDSASVIQNLSWFNRQRRSVLVSASGATASNTIVQIGLGAYVMNWSGEAVQVNGSGYASNTLLGSTPTVSLLLDTTVVSYTLSTTGGASWYANFSGSGVVTLAEGFHAVTANATAANGTMTVSMLLTAAVWG